MIYLLLTYEFFKIGLFSIGGGLATLPFIFRLSDMYPSWVTYSEISTMLAVSESTPGPIGINMSTYCGVRVAGPLGGICSTIGLVLPSLIIVLIIARFLAKFKENKWVKFAFYGLRATVIALISYAGYQVYRIVLFNDSTIQLTEIVLLAVLLFCMSRWKKVHPIAWIGIAALAGIILKL